MYPPVVLQVPRRGELLAAVLLLADERLLTVVGPHVNLQPLQHVEALPAALGAAPEHPVVPVERVKIRRVGGRCAHNSSEAANSEVKPGDCNRIQTTV